MCTQCGILLVDIQYGCLVSVIVILVSVSCLHIMDIVLVNVTKLRPSTILHLLQYYAILIGIVSYYLLLALGYNVTAREVNYASTLVTLKYFV